MGLNTCAMVRDMLRLGLTVAVLAIAFAPSVAAKSPATCSDSDRVEPGLQGQVPKASQGEDSRKGYWCAIRPVGHTDIDSRGANYQLAWSGDCAYVSTVFAGSEQEPAGVAVIDASDPRAPRVTGYLTGPGSAAATETLHAVDAPDRRVLVAGSYDTAPTGQLEVYDVTDCARPRLITTFETPYPMHNITLTRDARTLYVGTATSQAPHAFVVDLTDLSDPKVIATLDLLQMAPSGGRTGPLGIHRVEVSPDGRRAYAGVTSAGFLMPPAKAPFQGGELAILDTSDIAARKPSPQFRFVSQFKSGWHGPRWFRMGGREYVVGGDETNPAVAGPGSCEGVWPYIGDITDEKAPKPVGEFRMEIQETVNCPAAIDDGLLYATHYSDIDDPDDAALGLFPMYNSGLRVADIRDPARPREIGYFNPPPVLGTQFGDTLGPSDDVDLTGSNARYHPRTGHIWFASMTSGFWIVELAGSGPPRDLGLPPAAAPPAPADGSAPAGCLRTLRLKLPARGLRSARILVNGRLARTLRGRDLRVPVTLRRLPRGAVRVKIVARRRNGRTLTRTRRYAACERRSAAAGWSR